MLRRIRIEDAPCGRRRWGVKPRSPGRFRRFIRAALLGLFWAVMALCALLWVIGY